MYPPPSPRNSEPHSRARVKREKCIDISDNVRFSKIEEAMKSTLANARKERLGVLGHKAPITDKGIQKLYEYFRTSMDTAAGLKKKVWFDIMHSF